MAISFPVLIPCLIPPIDDRETTERRAKRYRALAAKNSVLFLRLSPKKVDFIPEKVVSLPKKVDCFPEIVAYPPNKKSSKSDFSCTSRKKSVSLRPNLDNCILNLNNKDETF